MATKLVCLTERTCILVAVNLRRAEQLFKYPERRAVLFGHSPSASSSIAGVHTRTRL